MENIDIKENRLLELDQELLDLLIKDNTTKKNILWATDMYKSRGLPYYPNERITVPLITGRNGNVIKPRTEKSKIEQKIRSKDKAEVFTPSWICNAQNNLIDSNWFGRKEVFNTEIKGGWNTVMEHIQFPNTPNKTWRDYVLAKRMEVSCGEAPYITSRYDMTTGQAIETKNRVGLLDRKLRVVSENTNGHEEWIEWSIKAMQSIYGYDWQGDNVLLARENVLFTVIEFYKNKFNSDMPIKDMKEFGKIIAWNIWQMDGIKFVIPDSCATNNLYEQLSFFDEIQNNSVCVGCLNNDNSSHTGIYVKVRDWSNNKTIKFIDLIRG